MSHVAGHLCQNPRACDQAVDAVNQVVLVWPPHAASIAFFLLLIALIVVLGWKNLRGDHCWKCGIETGLCRHTRYDEPKDPHGGVKL